MNRFLFKKYITWLLLMYIAAAGFGCALYSVSPVDSTVIAVVNGYDIDVDTFEKRIGNIHKLKPMVRPEGGAGGIDIQDIIEEMIDDRLIIQEAYRVKLDEDLPFRERVDNYIKNRSVIRLRKEEVHDKISVTEEELREYFNINYEEAKVRQDEGKPAPEEKFEKVKKKIKKKLFKKKEAKRSNDYLAGLKAEAEIRIDTERLYSLNPRAKSCDANIIIARVNKRPITACDFMEEASQKISRQDRHQRNREESEKVKQDIVDRLVIYELVEEEALGRNYMADPLFRKDVEEYKGNLLINFFKQEMILPRAIPTEKELKEYYETHKDKFKKDYKVWFSEMTFSTPQAAEGVLKELKRGADFEFLASKESLSTPPAGVNVWVPLGRLSPEMREGIKALEVGGISEVIQDSRKYKIIKLKGKRGGETEVFAVVADKVRQLVVKNKFNKWLQEYLDELRNVSSIYINKKLLNELSERYTKETS